jgi:L-ribulose-5-phosphate 3-epimerase UlaE
VQCIENCEVVPVNCPDSVCKQKGSLNQIEIESILLSEHLKENGESNDSCTLEDGLKFYNRYLKLCENIGIHKIDFFFGRND